MLDVFERDVILRVKYTGHKLAQAAVFYFLKFC